MIYFADLVNFMHNNVNNLKLKKNVMETTKNKIPQKQTKINLSVFFSENPFSVVFLFSCTLLRLPLYIGGSYVAPM